MKEDKTAKRKGEVHQNAPGRPASPTPPRRARTGTHEREPSSDPQGEVSASTQNSPDAPVESPVDRRTVRETGRVSDHVQKRKPPQRTQPKTEGGGTARDNPIAGP